MHHLLHILFCALMPVLVSCNNVNDSIFNEVEIRKDYSDILTTLNNDSINLCSLNNHYDISDLSLLMKQKSSGSVQGTAFSGDYMFQFQHGLLNIYVYDIKTKEHIFTLQNIFNNSFHCNNANFSTKFYSDYDLFPLLYVSQQDNKIHKTLVYRLVGDSIKNLEMDLVQIISGPEPTKENHMFYQDCILDNDNEYLYIYAHHKRDDQDSFHIVKYRLPDISIPYVELNDDYLYSSVFYDNQFSSPQGAICHNGLLYFIKGVPAWNENVLLDIVDFEKKEVCTINLTEKGFKKEPEGLCFYDDKFICATNNGGIYSFKIKEY